MKILLVELQCGHDPEAVERRGAGQGGELRLPGFNAATTRRPWRAPPVC